MFLTGVFQHGAKAAVGRDAPGHHDGAVAVGISSQHQAAGQYLRHRLLEGGAEGVGVHLLPLLGGVVNQVDHRSF